MIKSNCLRCGVEIVRKGSRPGVFCSLACKGIWQREHKIVNREWLYQKYVVQGLGAYRIAKMAGRDPKRVYDWLKGYGIQTRLRTWKVDPGGDKKYQQREWLEREYIVHRRSSQELADECWVHVHTIDYWLKKTGIQKRSCRAARKCTKANYPNGLDHHFFGKRGKLAINWQGGISSERQAFINSEEWDVVRVKVWERDGGKCQRCGKVAIRRPWQYRGLHIHHIVSFKVKELRAESSNLVLLCAKCHRWVHSRKNVNGEFIKRLKGGTDGI